MTLPSSYDRRVQLGAARECAATLQQHLEIASARYQQQHPGMDDIMQDFCEMLGRVQWLRLFLGDTEQRVTHASVSPLKQTDDPQDL